MAKSLGWGPQTHRRRCQRGGAGEQRQLCGHQKRPRLENGCHRRHGVDASTVPLFTVVGGSIRDGGRSPKSKRMEGRLWNFSDLMLQSCPVPGLRVREVECSGKLLHIVAWERGRASFSTEGGALRWRRHITSVTRVPAWPRERGVPGTGHPAPVVSLARIRLPPSSHPPSHDSCWSCFGHWTLETHR